MVNPPQESSRAFWLRVSVLTLLAFLLRVWGLGQEAFFIDEASTRSIVLERGWHGILTGEVNPPLHFWLLTAWSWMFGAGHVALRSVSALAGAATIPLLLLAGRAAGLRPLASWVLGLVLATSPMAIWWSQIARPYALSGLWIALWLWQTLRLATGHGRRWEGPALALVLLAGQATHYWFCFPALGGGLALAILWLRDRGNAPLRNVVLWHIAGGLLCLLLVPLVLTQYKTGNASWVPPATLRALLNTPTQAWLVGPFRLLPAWHQVAFLLVAVALANGAVWGLRNPPTDTGESQSSESIAWFLGLLATFAGLGLPWLLSRVSGHSIYLPERYTLVALPPFLLWLAVSLNLLKHRWLQWTGAVALLLVTVPLGLSVTARNAREFQDFDWRTAIRHIEAEPDLPILFVPVWMGTTYAANGGPMDRRFLTPEEAQAWPGPLWLAVWEHSTNPQDKALASALRARPGTVTAVDFPHIRLLRVGARK